jgi:rod shape-determining protein MreC
MAVYTPGRRRAILILLLSSLLILTIDLRGNAIFDGLRSGFDQAMRPFESASDVVSRPIRDAWRGITQYDELEAENRRLQDQIESQQANDVVSRSIIAQYYELLAINDLEFPGSYDRVTAYVVGQTPSNLDQIIEIDKGTDDGIHEGMAVIATNGLVGKITEASSDRSRVMLITDTQYAVQVKVVRPSAPTTTTVPTTTTAPLAPGVTAAATSTTTSTTTSTVPGATTTTVPPTTLPDPQRETGQLVGRGPGNSPEVVFVADTPIFGSPEVGDIVSTSGGSISLAPADLPIGVVTEVRQGSPSEGLIVVVQPYANLDDLEFVSVILYTSPSESASRPTTTQAD